MKLPKFVQDLILATLKLKKKEKGKTISLSWDAGSVEYNKDDMGTKAPQWFQDFEIKLDKRLGAIEHDIIEIKHRLGVVEQRLDVIEDKLDRNNIK